MHLDDYKEGDEIELTRNVCEKKKGDRGTVYKRPLVDGNAIAFPDKTRMVTGYIKLIKPAMKESIY